MRDLLRAWQHPPDAGPLTAAHAAAMGMATPAELRLLGTLSPAETEQLFLQLMHRHHQGAVWMARPLLGWRVRPQVRELARHIELTQQREIRVIRRMLRERKAPILPLPVRGSHEH